MLRDFLKGLFSKQTQPLLRYLPEKLVLFDLETTGLNSDTSEIIEIGAVKLIKGDPQQYSFSSLIKIKKKVPKKIVEITGITDALLMEEGNEASAVYDTFVEFCGDALLVSYNYAFDGPFLKNGLEAHSARNLAKNKTACALQMVRRAWPGLKSYKLANLAKKGGLAINSHHRALDDALRALPIYLAATDRLKSWK